MKLPRLALLFCTFLSFACSSNVRAVDWPQWLGPNREPVWQDDNIVDAFPDGGPPLRWKSPLGGGYSSPAISQGRVFVMDRIAESTDLNDGKLLHDGDPPNNTNFVRRLLPGRERVVCLDEQTGETLWTREYDCPYSTVALYAIGPRCTPTVDGNLVYTLGAEGHLHCLRANDGAIVWSRQFVEDYGLEMPEWGVASHPLVDGDLLICVVGGKDATVVAFDKLTGKEAWRALSARQPGYCPPVIYTIHGQRQLLIWDSDAVSSLNPATGELFWQVPFEPTFAMSIGAPQVEGDKVFVMAFNRKSAILKVAPDNRSASILWKGTGAKGIGGVLNTAIIRDGHIYACGNGGRYICAKVETGERVWQSYAPSTGTRPAAWANVFTVQQRDRFFHANDLGDLIIARMSPSGYEEISRAHLIEPTHQVSGRTLVWSHPAYANRCVFLRNDKEIRCYSLAKTPD